MSGDKVRARWLLLLLPLLVALGLRVWDLGKLPNGLHWDEQDTGYQAYSLLQTGRDYFGNPLPFFFHSLADWRTPVLIYHNVPAIAVLGLTATGVRLTSVIMGVLSVALVFLLGYWWFRNVWISGLAALVLTLSPWAVQYSRQGVETLTMVTYFLLGLTVFLRQKYTLAGLIFGLTLAGYSPAKLFVPMFLLALIWRSYSHKYFRMIIIFGLIFAYILLDNFLGSSGLRFGHLSVFTDPTVATQVDWQRKLFAISQLQQEQVGLKPTLIAKTIYNKPAEWLRAIYINYLRTFSMDYLFIKGDPELRHSPGKDSIGMLHLVEAVPLLVGLVVLITKEKNKIVLGWLALAPIPAALTRDGGVHAARLLILLPALVFTIAVGLNWLRQRSKPLFTAYCLAWGWCALFVFGYFFSAYRWESAEPFRFGYDQVIKIATVNQSKYQRIVVDGRDDSLLMAYWFYSKFPPAKLQTLQPLVNAKVYKNWEANILGNLYVMRSGGRPWRDIWRENPAEGKELYIISARQGDVPENAPKIYYPDRFIPAFYMVER